jgi:tetratricopeptide (TPR) repeat protein
MRNLILVCALAFLGACASNQHQKLQVDHGSGLFKGESLWRVSGTDNQESEWLRGCYQGELKAFTEKARLEYAQGAKTARYWVWVGNCLAWHSELREARFFLGLALDLAKSKEEQAMVKNNLGVLYLREGRTSRAYDMFVDASKLAPQFVTPAFNRAQIYVAQNLNLEALKILNQGQFEKSLDPEVLHLKGLAHMQSGSSKSATPFLSQIPQSFHSREDFALTLAQWHLWEGRPHEAQDILEKLQSTGLKSTAKINERLTREVKQQIAALEAKNK